MPLRRLFLLAAVLWPLMAPQSANAPVDVLPGCTVEPGMANGGGTRFTCPGSEWLGGTDFQGGRYVPGDPNKLNVNFAAGDSNHRGWVVVNPDVGKGTILEDGHLHKLAIFRAGRYGGTEFRTGVRFKAGLVVCDSRGCLNVAKALRWTRR